jgi:nitrogen regulatory protein P-II 1
LQAVFLVLEREEYLEELLEAFLVEGVSGATVIESTGMGKIMAEHVPIFASLRNIMGDNNIVHNHTVFLVVEDQDVAKALRVVEGVLGDLNQPNTGVFFSLPVTFAKGLRKN